MTQKIANLDAENALIEAILQLQTPAECRAFLEDICTVGELCALAQRWRVAQMLDEGKNYQEISRATGASSATVCRVNKCLTWGEGYRTVLDRCRDDSQD